MTDKGFGRRDFLKSAVVGGAAAATPNILTDSAQAAAPAAAPSPSGYAFLNSEEAAFVETLVDHMVPADELTPKGTDIGINIFIDRALAAPGARATGSTCRGRGSRACRARAISCR